MRFSPATSSHGKDSARVVGCRRAFELSHMLPLGKVFVIRCGSVELRTPLELIGQFQAIPEIQPHLRPSDPRGRLR